MSDTKLDFSKPAVPVDEQIQILIDRGLSISDKAAAIHFLQFVGYYRLSGYCRYFTDPQYPGAERFHADATFDRVVSLYAFDRKLRTLLQDALERIEISVKAGLSNCASDLGDPFWLCNASHFDQGSHPKILKDVQDCLEPRGSKQKHVFLDHFFNKYADPHPPVWMMMEAMSFGAVSRIYRSAKGAVRLPIAKSFGLQHDVLESWLHALTFARNTCAHHCRVWNRTFTIKPKVPKRLYPDWEPHKDKLFVIASIIQHLMRRLADESGWGARFIHLIDNRPDVPLRSMGFPENWKEQAPWAE